MKNLENIVPPMELCKQIPEGKFADSALVWRCSRFLATTPPKEVWEVQVRCNWYTADIPAPTLAEILEALEPRFDDCVVFKGVTQGWCVQVEDMSIPKCTTRHDLNSAAAAIRLWLDVNKEAER